MFFIGLTLPKAEAAGTKRRHVGTGLTGGYLPAAPHPDTIGAEEKQFCSAILQHDHFRHHLRPPRALANFGFMGIEPVPADADDPDAIRAHDPLYRPPRAADDPLPVELRPTQGF
jgi:hypothetical protein